MQSPILQHLLTLGLIIPQLPALAASFTLEDAWREYRAVSQEGKSAYLLDIDNDSLLLRRNDGFYTSGLRLTQQTTLLGPQQSTRYGWRLGQELYTTSDVKLRPAQISRPDHPYAGWLYAGLFREARQLDGGYSRLGLDIGCLGPCAGGEWTQTNLHRLLNQPLPQGWSTQFGNEFGAVLYGELAPPRWTYANWFDAAPSLHARLGNIHTDAGAGLLLRAGKLNSFPDQPALHGFLRVDGRLVGYNATLQGGYFSGDQAHAVQPRRWVGEAEIGVLWNRASYGVKVSIVRRGNEIRELSNAAGGQNFARVQFLYAP